MQRQFLNTLLLLFSLCQAGIAQSFDSLNLLKSDAAKIYFSKGHEKRASGIAVHVDGAHSYLAKLLEFEPEVTLLVLDTSDWRKFASPQAIYGMPHFDEKKKTLYVAAIDNPFWKSFLPPLDKIDPALAQQIKRTYKNESGEVSMQAFFDLLAIHELGHSFHLQQGLYMQRNWMSELFVNILLHTYIAEKQPQLLPALTMFPKMVIAFGADEFMFTTLADMQERYQEIATKHPKNYGWYQCRLHAGAAKIYEAGGKKVGKKIWNVLKTVNGNLSDEALTSLLETKVHNSVSGLIRNWDADSNSR